MDGQREGRRRTPGELPADALELPRDLAECDACGEHALLAPGSALCPPCDELARAAAEARRAAWAAGATSGEGGR